MHLHKVVLDFETTGVSILEDEPVQFGVAVYSPYGRPVFENSGYLIPKRPISEGSLAIHKIGMSLLKKEGKSLAWFANYWRSMLRRYEPVELLGYNLINFDFPILQRVLGRYSKVKYPQAPILRITDVMLLAQEFFHSNRWPKLSEAVSRLRIPESGGDFHDALADVRYTWLVYKTIMQRLREGK